MDKKHSRVSVTRYRSLLTTSANLRKGGSHSRKLHYDLQGPSYDPVKEAEEALAAMLKRKELRYYTMYRYASWKDILLMTFGVFCALGCAVCHPYLIYRIGTWAEIILNHQLCENEVVRPDGIELDFVDPVYRHIFVLRSCILMAFMFLCFFGSSLAFALTSENQICRIRLAYFESILRKDMSWLDNYVEREFGHHMTRDATLLRNGIGERVPYLVYCIVVVVLLLVMSFTINWHVSLITVLVFVPSISGVAHLSFYVEKRALEIEDELCDKAEVQAEHALSNIKIIKLFGAEDYETRRYAMVLNSTGKLWKYAFYSGICLFLLWLVYFGGTALAVDIGRRMVATGYMGKDNCTSVIRRSNFPPTGAGALFVLVLCALHLTLYSSEILTVFKIISETKKKASEVFFMIDWKSRIDNMSTEGDCPGLKAVGKIQLENICFKYPRRMNMNVLKNVNLTVHPGQLVALLGNNFSGKSTILRLIHRLYDPTHGTVFIDGRHIESLNVGWLRSQIGHVPEKPVLFNKSIEENVRFAKWSATQQEIEEACEKAGIHDDILHLPQGYKTIVGYHGKNLSFAQRKKIAFARAYLQRPKILLLDDPLNEADKGFEESLLALINKIRQTTTVVITASDINSIVRESDRIYVMERGEVLEHGSHRKLMELDGLYAMIEKGLDEGIPAGRKQKFFSQLHYYNFAKTLSKWKTNVEDSQEDGIEIEDRSYVGRKTLGIPWVAGGFNSNHYARKSTAAYSFRDGYKGITKFTNFNGLGILRRQLGSKDSSDSTFFDRRRSLYSNQSQVSLLPRSTTNVLLPSPKDTRGDLDTASLHSETYGEFWDDYETVLDSLEEDIAETSWKSMFAIGLKEWWIVGLASIICGALGICTALFHQIYGQFYEEITHSGGLDNREIYSSIIMFIIVGVVSAILAFVQNIIFKIGGYKLTSTLKQRLFQKMLAQDVEWFDNPENDISILCHRLSIDTGAIESALMITFGVFSQSFTGFMGAVTIILLPVVHGDRKLLTFILVTIPMSILFVGLLFVDGKFQLQWNKMTNKILTRVTEIEVDVVTNIRSVITLGLEEHFLAQVTEELKKAKKQILRLNILRTFLFGVTRVFPYLMYFVIAIINLTTNDKGYHMHDLILLGELFIQNQIRTGIGLAMLPNTESARAAAFWIRRTLKKRSQLMDPVNPVKVRFGEPPAVVVRNLCYSSPNSTIFLKDISFNIESKKFLGIVGMGLESGTSTLVNILARFYKPTSGSILLNETDIWSMDINSFRKEIAFIEESPNTFSLTMQETIGYGADSGTITIERIVSVAKELKIHDLIMSLPQGYQSKLGSMGNNEITYGLLQRLNVARALVRNPKVIFIDANTTWLNDKEDALLQEAFEICGKHRTKILSTERISSVQNADFIIVLQDGEIFEQGTHDFLFDNKKLYYQMCINQSAISSAKFNMLRPGFLEPGTARNMQRAAIAYDRYLKQRMFSRAQGTTTRKLSTLPIYPEV